MASAGSLAENKMEKTKFIKYHFEEYQKNVFFKPRTQFIKIYQSTDFQNLITKSTEYKKMRFQIDKKLRFLKQIDFFDLD